MCAGGLSLGMPWIDSICIVVGCAANGCVSHHNTKNMSYPGFLEKKLFLIELAVSRRPAGALTRQAPRERAFVFWGGEATPATQKDVPMLYFDRQILYGEGFHD